MDDSWPCQETMPPRRRRSTGSRRSLLDCNSGGERGPLNLIAASRAGRVRRVSGATTTAHPHGRQSGPREPSEQFGHELLSERSENAVEFVSDEFTTAELGHVHTGVAADLELGTIGDADAHSRVE